MNNRTALIRFAVGCLIGGTIALALYCTWDAGCFAHYNNIPAQCRD